MKMFVSLIALATGIIVESTSATPYSDRFVWVFGWNLRKDADVTEISAVLAKAASSGLNGAVLSASLDSLCKQPPDYFRRLREVKEACERLHLELIPSVFSVGYGGGTLAHNRQLAEGLPVEGALFIAAKDQAQFVSDSTATLINGGFEEFTNHRFKSMLDPNHNARRDYYLVNGDYTGSWNYVPKDLIIAVWGGKPRPNSLRFFADQGFRTLVACYYDADDLKEVQGWLDIARPIRDVRGFMYTPWTKKYGFLSGFGDLLQTAP